MISLENHTLKLEGSRKERNPQQNKKRIQNKMGIAVSSRRADYEILVKTGDIKGAGTDANVYIALVDDEGRKSRDILLDCTWRDDFEKGNTDCFKISNVPQLGEIKRVELWRDNKGLNDDWFVEWVKVKPTKKRNNPKGNNDNNNSIKKGIKFENEMKEGIPFPCNRWIKEDKKFVLVKYDAVLPQFDDRKEQRREELEEKRNKYKFAEKAPGLPRQVVKSHPSSKLPIKFLVFGFRLQIVWLFI